MSTHESYGIVKLEPPDPDYSVFSFTVSTRRAVLTR